MFTIVLPLIFVLLERKSPLYVLRIRSITRSMNLNHARARPVLTLLHAIYPRARAVSGQRSESNAVDVDERHTMLFHMELENTRPILPGT